MADGDGDIDYFYLHETPKLTYSVEVKPTPADTAKAEFHQLSIKGKLFHTEHLKREGTHSFPFDAKKHGIGVLESPVFVQFTFTKGKDKRDHVVVLSLAEPAVRTIEAPPEASPGEEVTLHVVDWDALAWDLPGLASVLWEKHPDRVIPEWRKKTRWWVEGKRIDPAGEKVTAKILDEHLGKTIPVLAYLGEKLPKKQPNRAMVSAVRRPWAEPAQASIVVPKLTIEGGDTVTVGSELPLKAKLEPALDGTYAWFDSHGKKLGEGETLTFKGQKKSKAKGDQPVECKFTSKATKRVYPAKHPITVEAAVEVRVPILISVPTADETVAWLGRNPIEVRVDEKVIGSHALVDRAGRIVVSFNVPSGEHSLVVTSASKNPAPGRPTVRAVHLTKRIKVTSDGSSSAPPKTADAPAQTAHAERPAAAHPAAAGLPPLPPLSAAPAPAPQPAQKPPDEPGGLFKKLKSKFF